MRATLIFAHLDGARLDGAHLEGAWLGGAHLKGVSLYKANVQGADFGKAKGVTQGQFDKTHGNEKTRLPDGITRPAHWTKGAAGQGEGGEPLEY